MRVNDLCAACLIDKQEQKTDNPEYLAEVKSILKNRKESDTAPYLVYLFNKAYKRRFGNTEPYKEIKRRYNDFVFPWKMRFEPGSNQTGIRLRPRLPMPGLETTLTLGP